MLFGTSHRRVLSVVRRHVGCCALAAITFAASSENATVAAAAGPAPESTDRRFAFSSTASAETTARIEAHVVRCLDRYSRFWPPREAMPRVPEVRLCGTLDEYRAALAERGLALANPACYLARDNLVLLGIDGAGLEAELQAGRKRTAALAAALDRLRAEHAERVRADEERFRSEGTPAATRNDLKRRRLQAFQQAENEAKRNLRRADEANQATFDRLADGLRKAAAHELFHAYAANFVYPPTRGELPRWLDEGLAQTVEHAAWSESGPRLDRPPTELVRRVREARGRKSSDGGDEPFDLRRLLEATPEEFLLDGAARDDAARRAAELNYLAAWSLTHFLLTHGDLKPGEALDRYVADRRATPRERFEQFVGRPPKSVEAEWRAWLDRL